MSTAPDKIQLETNGCKMFIQLIGNWTPLVLAKDFAESWDFYKNFVLDNINRNLKHIEELELENIERSEFKNKLAHKGQNQNI